MKELKTTIDITASHKEVWNKITDLSNWHIWNPIIYQLDGKFEPNSKLEFIMRNSKGEKGRKYSAQISNITSESSFSYTATMMNKFLFSAERKIELKEKSENVIEIKQTEKYSGILSGLFWKKLQEDAFPMIESMNKALKSELEK